MKESSKVDECASWWSSPGPGPVLCNAHPIKGRSPELIQVQRWPHTGFVSFQS